MKFIYLDLMSEFPDIITGKSYKGTTIEHETVPQIMNDLAQLLKDKGHKCVNIIGSSNYKFKWCQKDECPKATEYKKMTQENEDSMEFAEQLEKNGHTCVTIKESFPMRISWCRSDRCKDKNT